MRPVHAAIRRWPPHQKGAEPPEHQDETPWQSLIARQVEVLRELRARAARAEG